MYDSNTLKYSLCGKVESEETVGMRKGRLRRNTNGKMADNVPRGSAGTIDSAIVLNLMNRTDVDNKGKIVAIHPTSLSARDDPIATSQTCRRKLYQTLLSDEKGFSAIRKS